MKRKIVGQWNVRDELFILYLDGALSPHEPYRNCQIGGKIYKPIPMSHTDGKCVAVRGNDNFIGKEVEFVD